MFVEWVAMEDTHKVLGNFSKETVFALVAIMVLMKVVGHIPLNHAK
jgi:hypothetical protein